MGWFSSKAEAASQQLSVASAMATVTLTTTVRRGSTVFDERSSLQYLGVSLVVMRIKTGGITACDPLSLFQGNSNL